MVVCGIPSIDRAVVMRQKEPETVREYPRAIDCPPPALRPPVSQCWLRERASGVWHARKSRGRAGSSPVSADVAAAMMALVRMDRAHTRKNPGKTTTALETGINWGFAAAARLAWVRHALQHRPPLLHSRARPPASPQGCKRGWSLPNPRYLLVVEGPSSPLFAPRPVRRALF